MLLSGRILTSVASVNTFDYADFVTFTEGDGPAIFIQLLDASKDQKATPAGRRYMPATGAILQVSIGNVDAAKTVTRNATQVYPTGDPSIWMVQLLATDPVRGTADIRLQLTEGMVITRGVIRAGVRALPQNESFC